MLSKFNIFKRKEAEQTMLSKDTVKLGERKVRIRKITPKEFKDLISVTGNIPNLILQVMAAPEDQYAMYALAAAEASVDDFVAITSQLTQIDEDYITDQVGISEVVEYITQMVKYNDLGRMVKNVISLLPKATKKDQETTTEA
ncbi:Uncharacterized protein BCRIVMBC845_06475 [Bacillus cereus]|nr:Uncharacterized protein BCRIVMBC845_06475 [Bacillus cereus]